MLYFKTEQALLNGTYHSKSGNPSFIFFTVHKAGSSIISMRLSPLFAKNGYQVADLSSFFAKTNPAGRNRFFQNEKQKENVFSAKGIFYAAFRYPFSFPHFDEHKILLVLRDPRDVLVSHYFSTRFSHPVQNMDFAELKEQAGRMDIDQYVLHIADDFVARYSAYVEFLSKKNVLFLRYEDMISDPGSFEEKVRAFSGISINRGELVSAADFKVEKEDPTQHKRYVQSGDHKRKLQSETIAELNRRFGNSLEKFGYN